MPTLPIPTTSDGTHTDWTVSGTVNGWEAVLRESTDSTFVFSDTTGQETTFNCGPGWRPTPGRIMALTVHYRIRQTGSVGATVEMYITQGGTDQSAGNVVITPIQTDWIEGAVRVRQDWTTSQRFSQADVADLGVGMHMLTAPTSGRIEISQLWVEVEYVDGFKIYDPFDGALPDAVVGPLDWQLTAGSLPATITVDNYLEIADVSVANTKIYMHEDYDGMESFDNSYVVELETRAIVTDLTTGPDFSLFSLVGMFDSFASFWVIATKFGGDYYLCLNEAFAPGPIPTSLADFIAYVPFDYDGADIHVRITMDRDQYPDTYGKTRVFVNYDEEPIMEVYSDVFPANAFATKPTIMMGGTTFGECTTKIDYYAWKAYKKRGDTFSGWTSYNFSTNEINEDAVDLDVVTLETIEPPGVTVGQSDYACRFDVNDSGELCRLYQIPTLQAATNYKIDVDYKMDIAGVDGELVVQRLPDLFFWDETGGSWSATPASVDLTNTTTRSRVASMTGVNLAATGQVVISVQAKITAATAHKIWVYKVYLVEE